MAEPTPFQYQSLLFAAARAKRIRWGAHEGGKRSVRRSADGRGLSGSDVLAALLAETPHSFTSAQQLKARWLALGGSDMALRGTLLRFRKMGFLDARGVGPIDIDKGVMAGSYRLNSRYLETRKARAAKGATRAFEAIYSAE